MAGGAAPLVAYFGATLQLAAAIRTIGPCFAAGIWQELSVEPEYGPALDPSRGA